MNKFIDYQNLLSQLKVRMSEIDATEFKFVGFHNWLNKKDVGRGLKRGSIYNARNTLNKLIGKVRHDPEYMESPVENKEVTRIWTFLDYSKKYLAEVVKDSFSNKVFLFYFMHLGEDNVCEPQLASVILQTQTNGEVSLINLDSSDDPFSEDYSGTYKFLRKDVLFVDLMSDDQSRVLHLKITFHSSEDEIMLGTYNTFNRRRVFSGALVLHQFTKKKIERYNIKPALLSWYKNQEGFKKIPKAIREYLSLRYQNFYLLPEPHPDLKALKLFVDSSDILDGRETQFLEVSQPYLFLAYPQLGENDKEGQISNGLKEMIKGVEETAKKNNLRPIIKGVKEGDFKSTNSLKMIKTARFFVLIIPEKQEMISFSSIQLGWALAYCKNIMIFFEPESITDRFKSLEAFDVERRKLEPFEVKEGSLTDKTAYYDQLPLKRKEYVMHELNKFIGRRDELALKKIGVKSN